MFLGMIQDQTYWPARCCGLKKACELALREQVMAFPLKKILNTVLFIDGTTCPFKGETQITMRPMRPEGED